MQNDANNNNNTDHNKWVLFLEKNKLQITNKYDETSTWATNTYNVINARTTAMSLSLKCYKDTHICQTIAIKTEYAIKLLIWQIATNF